MIANCLALIAAMACFAAEAHPLDPTVDYRLGFAVQRMADGSIARNTAIVTAFRRQWPCPATGKTTGACNGWAVDHVIPLACGGLDAVWNMQWLPTQIKSERGQYSKDHFERRIYGGHNLSKGCK